MFASNRAAPTSVDPSRWTLALLSIPFAAVTVGTLLLYFLSDPDLQTLFDFDHRARIALAQSPPDAASLAVLKKQIAAFRAGIELAKTRFDANTAAASGRLRRFLYLLVACCVFTMFGIATWMFQRMLKSWQKQEQSFRERDQRLSQELSLHVRELQTSLADKNALLQEVQHRVKNNLAVIAALMNSCGVDNRKVQLHTSVQARLGLTEAVPCGLILNEFLTNSLKHAFPNGRSGNKWFSLVEHDGQADLHFRDDGVGFPPAFDNANSNSLGMQLVSDLATQMDGTLKREPGAGTHFHIHFHPRPPQTQQQTAS